MLTYDTWGAPRTITDGSNNDVSSDATHIANINPIRYRGYYYDIDTGFYYVSSRYYDPEVGRFISPDKTDVLTATPNQLTDKNLYAYCDNNPIIRKDDGGEFWHIAIGAAIGAVVGAVAKVVSNVATGQKWSDGVGMAALSGAASGALASTGVGLVGSIAGNAAISMASNVTNQLIKNQGFNNFDTASLVVDTVIGGVSGAIGGRGFGSNHLKTVSKQLTKRVTNAVTHNGVSVAAKETKQAVVNYAKNTMTLISRGISRGIVGATASGCAMSIAYYHGSNLLLL